MLQALVIRGTNGPNANPASIRQFGLDSFLGRYAGWIGCRDVVIRPTRNSEANVGHIISFPFNPLTVSDAASHCHVLTKLNCFHAVGIRLPNPRVGKIFAGGGPYAVSDKMTSILSCIAKNYGWLE